MMYIEATKELLKKSSELTNKQLNDKTTHSQVEELLLINLDATLQAIALNTAAIADELLELNEREAKK